MALELPSNLVGLFIAVVMGLLGLLTWVVRRTLILSAKHQERIVDVLSNHLAQISAHMAKTNTVLDLMISRLLDAALRKPVDGNDDRREAP